MRAVVLEETGGPEVVRIKNAPVPDPSPDDIRVRIGAFGINRADILQRRGMYPAPPGSPADIPGLEYAGVVDAVGANVEGLSVDDRVMGIVGGGSYAEFLITPADHAITIPNAYSIVEAAAIPEVFITAHDALERIAVTDGEWVLVHAVGSGVGTAALQLIKARHARCIGTSRTASKLERAMELGLDEAIDSTADELVPTVRRITGDGANAAVDLVGGSMFPATLDSLALRGRLVLVGITAGPKADVNLAVLLRRRLSIEGTVLRSRSTEEKSHITSSFREQVLPLLADKRVEPVIDRIFPFSEVAVAHSHMESNSGFGKIVVEID